MKEFDSRIQGFLIEYIDTFHFPINQTNLRRDIDRLKQFNFKFSQFY